MLRRGLEVVGLIIIIFY